ncbi:MAG: hypothetical protein JW790_00565 [Dehalococcoidales bacterium]|jgi:hypothetical protein|nr:hypothetical protein [Dehalococcoidales bacterium]
MRKILIITVTLLAVLLPLAACAPAPEQPNQDQLSFYLVSDATPGDTDAYAGYTLTIYLEEGQELDLAFSAQGAALRVSLFSPSEKTYGYRPTPPEDAEAEILGQLKQGLIISAEEGSFIFTAPETGYYAVTLQSASPKAEIAVELEYHIN